MAEGTAPSSPPQHRDIVVIGGSAGALGALERILYDLPADLPAMVFVVIHLGATSHLAEVLRRRTSLRVASARSGARIEPGHVYVAVPGLHLMLHDHHLLLRRGPRENLSRPAIDVLFRSAACTFGSRVIGVLLSGALNDGTAGLQTIRQGGGSVLVQDPRDAAYPDMPRSALRYVAADHIGPAAGLGAAIVRTVGEAAGPSPEVPHQARLEAAIAAQELAGMAVNDQLGELSGFTCPECQGALWEIRGSGPLRYRCHVGHALTAETVLAEQAVRTEEMLWSLMRGHQERAELARRMADRESSARRGEVADQLRQRARGYDEDAQVVERLLREHRGTVAVGAPEEEDS